MNTLASGLIWGGVQVSLLMLAGGLVYAIVRRLGPAAGSMVALATLVMAIGLSAMALSPWPTWWRLHVATSATAVNYAALPVAHEAAANTTFASGNSSVANPQSLSSPGTDRMSAGAGARGDATTWARTFWTTFWDGLGNRAAAQSSQAHRWPMIAVALLLAGVSLGLLRLLLGLAAVERCRRRTQPIADTTLNELLRITRDRLGCRRAIELRESAEITAPATVGWRRPLILLPAEWRTWSERELQVVFVHEVAHVRRGDFLGALIAQLTVTLHFYNPLVHWLARQLRVEQELAADAWGATLAGGSTAYLTTLAGMALRQDDRSTIWAARPFLPARGTLLRRIEMLRDRKQPQTFAFSTPKQIVLWSAAIAIGLLIAGLRGPDGSTPSLAAAQADASSPPTAPEPATHPGTAELLIAPAAHDGGSGRYRYIFVADEAAPRQQLSFSLDYVPENAPFVVAARVNELATSPALRMVQAGLKLQISDFEKKAGFSLSDIGQVTFVDDLNTPAGCWRRTILRASKPIDWTKFAATIVHDPVAVDSPLAALAGKKYYKPGYSEGVSQRVLVGGSALCYIVPDDRTIIFGPESEMNWILADLVKPSAKPEWADFWRQASTGATEIMIDFHKLRQSVEPQLHKGNSELLPYLSVAGPIWTDSQRLVIGTDLGDKKLGLLILDQCGHAEQVSQTAQALLTLAGNALAALGRNELHGGPDDAAMQKALVNVAAELVKQAKVSYNGDTVAIRSEAEGATLLTISGFALPAIASARASANATRSTHKLKQLALAMRNYNEKYGHLPPAVVTGPDGKTPHSWRVELLPFLERPDLYSEYHMDQPWDSPANKKILDAGAPIFHSGEDGGPAIDASYFVLTGRGTMFSGHEGLKLNDMSGAPSDTIMIVAAKRNIPWTKPEDIDYEPKDSDNVALFLQKPFPELGLSPKWIAVAFADGSVRLISKSTDEQILRALISPQAYDKHVLEIAGWKN